MLILGLIWIACSNEPKWDDETLELLATQPDQLKMTLAAEPTGTQDLLLLTLAIRNPSSAGQFCKQVHTETAKDKCRQVIGRPHLQLDKPQLSDVPLQKSK